MKKILFDINGIFTRFRITNTESYWKRGTIPLMIDFITKEDYEAFYVFHNKLVTKDNIFILDFIKTNKEAKRMQFQVVKRIDL